MNSEYSIPIVQGTAVPASESQQYNKSSYGPTTATLPNNRDGVFNDEEATTINFNHYGQPQQQQQQQQQPNQFKDVIWAVAFVLHLGAMLFVISMNIANGDGGGGAAAAGSYTGIYILVAIAVVVSGGLSSASIALMMKYPTEMVKAGLVSSGFLVGAMAIMSLMSGSIFVTVISFLFFAATLYYIKVIWRRIPFAAINLKTALSAVKSNMGLGVIAYLIMTVAFGWTALWLAGAAGSYATANAGIGFLLLVSYYWTYQVLCNTVHVTTAGTVGTWWFVPGEANGCWSTALRDSFCRASTYSFGSICLGSLLVAVVQALRMMAHHARQNEDLQLLYCVIECILACIQDIVEYFNKWAYVYVGLYGFGYIEAGRNVVQLFQSKGWSVLITDDLNDRVLLMMSISIGALTGIAGMLAAIADDSLLGDLGDQGSTALIGFLITFVIGLVFSSILMSVVSSAVNTVIVCFAESPAEFEANHPSLSREMRSAWMEAWPELTI